MYDFERGDIVYIRDFPFGKPTRIYGKVVGILPGEYYNIGGSYTCSVRDMLNYLISLSTRDNITVTIDPNRLRPIDADLQVPDVTKFSNHTGWTPSITFEQTMLDLLNYWRDLVSQDKRYLTR